MPARPPVRPRRWQAALIIALFFMAVAGSAAVGWWYARESPPHHGPIVLISIDSIPADAVPAYGAAAADMPAIDALASDSVVFDRAYTHSPQMLPAHASLLSGLLPPQHGVRDDAGFRLARSRTLAAMLRNRGFATGAAVSSFLLRQDTGIGTGFTFFDADLPPGSFQRLDGLETVPAVEREGTLTAAAAEQWLRTRDEQRFFLFVQVDRVSADAVVARVADALKQRDLYDDATIVVVGSRGDTGSGLSLDETALRVPLIVKQPDSAGAGRHVIDPVQHVDLVPTILDLVRAPIPDELPGRSLRAVLDDDGTVAPRPIYAETLEAYYRVGGHPVFAVADGGFRYVRGRSEDLVAVSVFPDETPSGAASEMSRLRRELDRLLAGDAPAPRSPLQPADEERIALFGYLAMPDTTAPGDLPDDTSARALDGPSQHALVDAHRTAAILIGQKKYSAGIRALQAIARQHPTLAPLRYQLGVVLARTGRLDEAIAQFAVTRELRPSAVEPSLALASALLRAGKIDDAAAEAEEAIALVAAQPAPARPRHASASHEVAARVALARRDAVAATTHADAAHAADATSAMPQFVRGRLLYETGDFEGAVTAFTGAATTLREHRASLQDLHLYLGESLSRLGRYPDAETQFRQELIAFPRNIQAYTSLAMLYRASNREDDVEDVLNELVAATPTPEGYAVAAQLWTVVGNRTRAEALRSDARTRFRDDPSLALLGRDGRR